MKNVAIIHYNSKDWIGGVNYFHNLFHALELIKKKTIQIVLFTGRKTDTAELKKEFPHFRIIKSFHFSNLNGFIKYVWNIYIKLIKAIFHTDYFNHLLNKNNISVCSHSWIYGEKLHYRTVNWIPDFQHLHIPEMFSKEEIIYRNRKYLETIEKSDCIILSSNNTLVDFKNFAPKHTQKAVVMHFVSYIDKSTYKENKIINIRKKYKIVGKFFYAPNQFWKHKNHGIILEAINLLKKERKNIVVIFSGYQVDKRDKTYYSRIISLIDKYKLNNNVKILGFINHSEVLQLMRYSISVINPSLFEGWSTTVEEVKSLGKNIILSNIEVHKEQNPSEAIYFDPHNPKELAEILDNKWKTSTGGPDFAMEQKAQQTMEKRCQEFGLQYEKIIIDLISL